MKKLLKVGAVLCAVGVCLLAIGYFAGGMKYVKASDMNKLSGETNGTTVQIFEEKLPLEGIKRVDVKLDYADMEIRPSEDDNFYLYYRISERKGKNPFSYEMNGETLELEEKGEENNFQLINIDISFLNWLASGNAEEYYQEMNDRVILYVPVETVLESCEISIGDGDLILNELVSKTMNAALSYGDLSMNACRFDNSTIAVHDGDMLTEHMTLKNASAALDYGDCTLLDVAVEASVLTMNDGDLEGSNVDIRGSVTMTNNYGDIALMMMPKSSAVVSLLLDTSYGDIEIGEEWSGTRVRYDDDDVNHYEYTAKQEEGSLTVTVNDGDIEIR